MASRRATIRRAPGGFLAPHAVRTDSRGDLYVGETPVRRVKLRGLDRHELHVIHKFARVRG